MLLPLRGGPEIQMRDYRKLLSECFEAFSEATLFQNAPGFESLVEACSCDAWIAEECQKMPKKYGNHSTDHCKVNEDR